MAEPLRTTLRACLVLAALGAVGGLLAGNGIAGAACALGVLFGSGNGLLAGRMVAGVRKSGSGPAQVVTMSMARLVGLGLLAVAGGLVLSPAYVPLVVAGVALAQAALAVVSVAQGVRA